MEISMSFKSITFSSIVTSTLCLSNLIFAEDSQTSENTKTVPTISFLSPRRPKLVDTPDVFFEGSLLYWQATETGLTFVVPANLVQTASSHSTNTIGYKDPDFRWDFGFAVGAGYNTTYDGWDIHADWTHFHPKSSSGSVTASETNYLLPVFLIEPLTFIGSQPQNSPTVLQPGGDPSTATGKWKLKLDLVDLELGRESYFGEFLFLRFHMGLRSAWIHQNLKVVYDRFLEDVSGENLGQLTALTTVNVHLKNNFWGMGPRAGLDSQWNLGCGVSVFGNVALSALVGQFSLSDTETHFLTLPDTSIIESINIKSKIKSTKYVGDFEAGFRWEYPFVKKQYAFMMQIAWEQHLFLNQNQFIKNSVLPENNVPDFIAGTIIPIVNQGDLSTQGMTFTVRFDF